MNCEHCGSIENRERHAGNCPNSVRCDHCAPLWFNGAWNHELSCKNSVPHDWELKSSHFNDSRATVRTFGCSRCEDTWEGEWRTPPAYLRCIGKRASSEADPGPITYLAGGNGGIYVRTESGELWHRGISEEDGNTRVWFKIEGPTAKDREASDVD